MPFDLARRLIAAKIVAPEAMAGALRSARFRGVTVSRALVDEGAVTELELELEIERHCGAPIDRIALAEDLAIQLPAGMCRRLGAVPAVIPGAAPGAVDLVCLDPLEPHVATEMQGQLGQAVRVRRAAAPVVDAALAELDALLVGLAALEADEAAEARAPEARSPDPPSDEEPAPRTARSSVAPPPVAADPGDVPGAVGVALDVLRAAAARDEILVRSLSCLALIARRAGIFAVRSDGFRGLVCTESLAVPESFRRLVVGRDDASIFSTAIAVGLYLGPIPATPTHVDLLGAIGAPLGDVAVAVVDVSGRPAMILLADGLSDAVTGTRVLDAVARAAGYALAVCMRARPREGSGPHPGGSEGSRSDIPRPRRSATPPSPGWDVAARRPSDLPPVVPVVPPRARSLAAPSPSPLPGAAGARARIPTPAIAPVIPEDTRRFPTPLLPFGAPVQRTPTEPRPPDRSFTPMPISTAPGPGGRRTPSGSMPALAGLAGLGRSRTTRPPPAGSAVPPPPSVPEPRASRPIALVWEPARVPAESIRPAPPSERARVRTQPTGLAAPLEPDPVRAGAQPTGRVAASAPEPLTRTRTQPTGIAVPAEVEAPTRPRPHAQVAAPDPARPRPSAPPGGGIDPAVIARPRTVPPARPAASEGSRPSVPPGVEDGRPAPASSRSRRATRGEGLAPSPFELAHALVLPGGSASESRSAPRPADARPRFEVIGPIAQATTGEVVVARDDRLGRNVAYKRLPAELAQVPELTARLRREARLLAKLDHPGIAPIYELETDRDASAYAMKLVEGRTLAKVLAEARADVERLGAAIDERRVTARIEAFVPVCDAVGFAHGKRVVHRDLEPDHVVIGAHHEVWVLGWDHCRVLGEPDGGLAGPASAVAPGSMRGHAGLIIGNPAYMAPEQAERRDADVDARSDVFTLGLLLQEIATLRPARVADRDEELLEAARAGKRAPLGSLPTGEPIPAALRAIIDKAAALRRQDRYPGAASLAADLRAYLAGERVSAHEETAIERAVRFAARRASKVVAATAIATAIAVLSVAVTVARELHHAAARERRERQTSAFLLAASERGRALDACFHRARAQVALLASRAAEALTGPDPGPIRAYSSADFDDASRAPSDLLPSRSYGGAVSLAQPSFHVVPGREAPQVGEVVGRLVHLRRSMERAFVEGSGLATVPAVGELRRLILDQGLPVHRVRLALSSGVRVAWPGMGAAADGGDVRATPDEAAADASSGVRFTGPQRDRPGPGLVEVASTPIVDARGVRHGVASLEIALDWVRAVALAPAGPWVDETLLVDDAGAVVIRRAGPDAPAASASSAAPSEPAPVELGAALSGRRAGRVTLERRGRRAVAVIVPLEAIGLTYVAIADEERLLDE